MKKNNKIVSTLSLLIIATALFQINVFAQMTVKEIREQSQRWFSINSTIRLRQNMGMMVDVHERRNNFVADPGFYFARVGTNYWLKDNIITTAGYAQLWAAPSKAGWHHYALEKRVYEQIQISTKIGKIRLLNRLRNEQSWQEKIVKRRNNNHRKCISKPRFRRTEFCRSLVLNINFCLLIWLQFRAECVKRIKQSNACFAIV